MNYRHAFHAGNFCDVVKHIAQLMVLTHLHHKPKPFCYLDTHAGVGLYGLHDAQAQRTGEYTQGIARIWEAPQPPPDVVTYLDFIRSLNPGGELKVYPGSPAVAAYMLRAGDRAVLCELHPEDAKLLKDHCHGTPQIAVHNTSGYDGLKAFLPPKENRGLVLIDPPFEKIDEFSTLAASLVRAHKRWANGTIMAWYPIKSTAMVEGWLDGLATTGAFGKLLAAHLLVKPPSGSEGLIGTGLVVINPPYLFDEKLGLVLEWLRPYLAQQGAGESKVWWLS